jgi:hypothetical protein
MRTALQLPVEKLDQMGRAGAERVAFQHDAKQEATRLAALFPSNIEKTQASAAPPPLVKAFIPTARSN